MNWLTIRTWAMANFRTVFFITGIILLSGYILFGGSSPDASIPGGGFGTLIIAGLLFFGSYKTAGPGSKILAVFGTILLIVWAWPRVFPILSFLNIVPNIILILAVLTFLWMWFGGKGLLGWRMWLFIFLVLCWIGANGKLFKDGFNSFLSSTGITLSMPKINIQMPEFIKGITGYIGHASAQKISQSKERSVKKDAKFYDYNGAQFTEKSLPVSKDEFIKVFILEEQIQKNGMTFEKIRVGDPATGEDAWIYSGELLSVEAPANGNTSAVKNPTPRELVGSFPIYLSGNSFNLQVGKNGERRGTGEIFIPHMCEAGYQYFFTVSGEYEKFFWRLPYKKITYSGNDAVAGQNVRKPFPILPYGALTLRIGDKDGLVPMSGKSEIQAMIISPTPIFAELNINREIGDYFDARAVDSDKGNKLKNSTLSVKIERRRLIE